MNETARRPRDGRPRVLIVEDDAGERCFLETLLKSEYDVRAIPDAESADEALNAFGPQLILLDVMLAGEMDGIDLCRRIKREQQRHEVKIIVLTASGKKEVKLSALEAGASDFVGKPADPVELLTRVENLLRAAELERRLVERNAELETAMVELKAAQEHLIQAEKLNALGTMAAGLIHELGNPLSYAKFALELAQDRLREGDKTHEMVTDALEGIERIAQLLEELEAFTQGRDLAEMTPVQLSHVVKKGLRDVEPEAAGVEIQVDVPEECAVEAGELQIRYLLQNLLRNALESLRQVADLPHPRIEVSAQPTADHVVVRVGDNGPGVAPEHLTRIFDPFFTTREERGAMGIGLAVCHRIAGNHGGHLEVQSEPGRWTEFRLTLKRAHDEVLGDG